AQDTKHGLAVLAAARPSPRTRSFLSSLSVDALTLVELGGLGQAEGIDLAQSLAPDLSDAQAAELWHRADGSPFWLDALARSGGAHTDANELVRTRLHAAGADAVLLLALLAVAGRPLLAADASEL